MPKKIRYAAFPEISRHSAMENAKNSALKVSWRTITRFWKIYTPISMIVIFIWALVNWVDRTLDERVYTAVTKMAQPGLLIIEARKKAFDSDYASALSELDKALEIIRKTNFNKSENLADAYTAYLEILSNAPPFSGQSEIVENIATQLKQDRIFVGVFQRDQLARSFLALGKLEKAREIFYENYISADLPREQYDKAYAGLGLGLCAIANNDPDTAFKYLNEAFDITIEIEEIWDNREMAIPNLYSYRVRYPDFTKCESIVKKRLISRLAPTIEKLEKQKNKS